MTKSDRKKDKLPSALSLKGRTYASFVRGGMQVRLRDYFKTKEGQEAFRKVVESATFSDDMHDIKAKAG